MGGCLTRENQRNVEERLINKQHLSTFCNVGWNFLEERTTKIRGIRRRLDKENIKAGAYLGGFGGPGSPGSQKGRQKERKKERKRNGEREKGRKKRKRRKKSRKNERNRGQERKIKVSEHDERGDMQFQAQAGLKGRRLQGRSIDGEKENKLLNCQTYFPFGLKIWNVVFLNSIIMILFFFYFLIFFFFYVSPVFHYTSAVPSLKL